MKKCIYFTSCGIGIHILWCLNIKIFIGFLLNITKRKAGDPAQPTRPSTAPPRPLLVIHTAVCSSTLLMTLLTSSRALCFKMFFLRTPHGCLLPTHLGFSSNTSVTTICTSLFLLWWNNFLNTAWLREESVKLCHQSTVMNQYGITENRSGHRKSKNKVRLHG